MKSARELKAGDVFRLHVFYEVIGVIPVGDDGKQVLIAIKPENQSELEFIDGGRGFFCRGGRTFAVYNENEELYDAV